MPEQNQTLTGQMTIGPTIYNYTPGLISPAWADDASSQGHAKWKEHSMVLAMVKRWRKKVCRACQTQLAIVLSFKTQRRVGMKENGSHGHRKHLWSTQGESEMIPSVSDGSGSNKEELRCSHFTLLNPFFWKWMNWWMKRGKVGHFTYGFISVCVGGSVSAWRDHHHEEIVAVQRRSLRLHVFLSSRCLGSRSPWTISTPTESRPSYWFTSLDKFNDGPSGLWWHERVKAVCTLIYMIDKVKSLLLYERRTGLGWGGWGGGWRGEEHRYKAGAPLALY